MRRDGVLGGVASQILRGTAYNTEQNSSVRSTSAQQHPCCCVKLLLLLLMVVIVLDEGMLAASSARSWSH